MLAEKYVGTDLKSALIPHGSYTPFPQACERPFWEGLPESLRRKLIASGEAFADYQWPVLPAQLYMENKQNGNRSRYESAYFARRAALGALALAECAEAKGRFLPDIVNGIWCVCEESTWCVPAHMDTLLPDVLNPVIDLFAAETASILSWVQYLLKEELDILSPTVCERIGLEVKKRTLDPFLERDDFWWMGLVPHPNGPVNNWNPWCNSNCLAAFLLMEHDTERRATALRKCLFSLDRFLLTYHADGGCDEGTSYWGVAGGALFDCLELLHGATGGAIDVYDEPLIGNIGRFICRAHIAGEYYINFADGGAKASIPAELVWRYGVRIGDAALQAQGASAFRIIREEYATTAHGSLFRPLCGVVNYDTLRQAQAAPPLRRDVWMPDIEVMAAREKTGSAEGLYLAAKGGHNSESHNHNDVGSFIVYSDGHPLLIDVGVETYTAKTFSPDRYSIWTMQSQYHNLPTVNGIQQRDGSEYRAKEVRYLCGDGEVSFELDIAGAYPEEAGIKAWKRAFRFRREGMASIEITDGFTLEQAAEELTFNFMTCCEHEISTEGCILFKMPAGRDVRMSFDSSYFAVASERIEILDEKLAKVWGDHLYRIMLRAKSPVRQGTNRMLLEQA